MNHQANQMLFSYLATKNAKYHPNKMFIKDENRQITFKEFDQRTNALARGLIAQGLKPGDRVCLINHNCIEVVEIYFGVMKAGGIAVPINTRLAPLEYEEILKNIEPKIFIVGKDYLGKAEAVKQDAWTWTNLYIIGKGKSGSHSNYETLIQGFSTARLETIGDNDDTVLIILTSGTTGKPKGAMISNTNLIAAGWTFVVSRRLNENDIGLVTAPISLAGGLGGLIGLILRGCTINLVNGFDLDKILITIEREKVTTMLFVPAMIIKLLQYPEIKKYDLSSIRKFGYGSAPMPVPTLKELMNVLGWQVLGACGATECMACNIAVLPYEDHCLDGSQVAEKLLYSIGKEAIDAEVRIFDDDDNELPSGEIGEIVLRGPHIMKGYWRKPEETEEALSRGWLHLGDLGYIDENEYIYIVDRKKDMLISGGFNVYPKEIENVLDMHPAVLESAVIGIPHEKWGETPLAFVALRKDISAPTEEELMEFMKDKIASYKMPKGGIRFIDEIPRNPTGKIFKKALRKEYGNVQKKLQ